MLARTLSAPQPLSPSIPLYPISLSPSIPLYPISLPLRSPAYLLVHRLRQLGAAVDVAFPLSMQPTAFLCHFFWPAVVG